LEPAYADDATEAPARSKVKASAVSPPNGSALAAKDPLALLMPTGEVGPRDTGTTSSTESGGTSKTEDTSRAAGYVADLARPSEPPPGPPVEKSPEDFAGPESMTVPPQPSKPAA
jgi:hypothetical protein